MYLFLVVNCKRNLLRCVTMASYFYVYTIKNQVFRNQTQTTAGWHMPVIPVLRRHRQRDGEVLASLENSPRILFQKKWKGWRCSSVVENIHRASGPPLGQARDGMSDKGNSASPPSLSPKAQTGTAWHLPSKLIHGTANADSVRLEYVQH